jgi:hypothetical protein
VLGVSLNVRKAAAPVSFLLKAQSFKQDRAAKFRDGFGTPMLAALS